MVQWSGLHATNAGGEGLIPSCGTRILLALGPGPQKRQLLSWSNSTIELTLRFLQVLENLFSVMVQKQSFKK